MDWRACALLARLGHKGIFPRMHKHRAVPEDARPRYGRIGARALPGDSTTVHRRHSMGALGNLAKRFVHSFMLFCSAYISSQLNTPSVRRTLTKRFKVQLPMSLKCNESGPRVATPREQHKRAMPKMTRFRNWNKVQMYSTTLSFKTARTHTHTPNPNFHSIEPFKWHFYLLRDVWNAKYAIDALISRRFITNGIVHSAGGMSEGEQLVRLIGFYFVIFWFVLDKFLGLFIAEAPYLPYGPTCMPTKMMKMNQQKSECVASIRNKCAHIHNTYYTNVPMPFAQSNLNVCGPNNWIRFGRPLLFTG